MPASARIGPAWTRSLVRTWKGPVFGCAECSWVPSSWRIVTGVAEGALFRCLAEAQVARDNLPGVHRHHIPGLHGGQVPGMHRAAVVREGTVRFLRERQRSPPGKGVRQASGLCATKRA